MKQNAATLSGSSAHQPITAAADSLSTAGSSGVFYDVFNGDADGICALHQLRLHEPRLGKLITGIKRDITLLEQLRQLQSCHLTVLDISLDANRSALLQVLAQGNTVFYVDHHFCGELPDSPLLTAHINTSPQCCTSLLVDRLLAGRFAHWAIVASFGDNLEQEARQRAQDCGLDTVTTNILQEVGRLLNYNAYGFEIDDLYVHPAKLYTEVHEYRDPLAFAAESVLLQGLREQYTTDLAQVAELRPIVSAHARAFVLPQTPWARRLAGLLVNQMARDCPDKAHAILVPRGASELQVSVRAPLTKRQGADTLCRDFISGGGRAAAAGINRLPVGELETFLAHFAQHFSAL